MGSGNYKIRHSCGHAVRHEIHFFNAAERDRQQGLIAARACEACQHAELDIVAESSAAAEGLPSLIGSPRQIAYANSLRAAARERVRQAIVLIEGAAKEKPEKGDLYHRASEYGRAELDRTRGITSARAILDELAGPEQAVEDVAALWAPCSAREIAWLMCQRSKQNAPLPDPYLASIVERARNLEIES